MAEFDPYEEWLGIPKHKRPLTAYRLVGVRTFEEDRAKIKQELRNRISTLKEHEGGPHAKEQKKVLKKLAEAQRCLLDPEKKKKYDQALRKQMKEKIGDGGEIKSSSKKKPQSNKKIPKAKPAPPLQKATPLAPAAPPIAAAPADPFDFSSSMDEASEIGGSTYSSYNRKPQNENAIYIWMSVGCGLLLFVFIGAMFYISSQPDEPVVAANTEEGSENGTAEEGAEPKANNTSAADAEAVGGLLADPAAANQGGGTTTPDPSGLAATGVTPEATDPLTPGATPEGTDQGEDGPEAKSVIVVEEYEEPDDVPWSVELDLPSSGPRFGVLQTKFDSVNLSFSPTQFAFSVDRSMIAFATSAGKLEVVESLSGESKMSLTLEPDDLVTLAFPEPDFLLVWTRSAGLLRLPLTAKQEDLQDPSMKVEIPVRTANPNPGIAVSPTGRYIALVRKGIRIYDTTGYALVGIIPMPEHHSPVSIGFHPEGNWLVLISQSIDKGAQFFTSNFSTESGEEGLAYSSAGLISNEPGFVGPINFFKGDQNRIYFFLKGQYAINNDNGKIVWMAKEGPELSIPLNDGNFWIANGKTTGMAKVDWQALEKTIRDMEQTRGRPQLVPGQSINFMMTGNIDPNMKKDLKSSIGGYLASQGFDIVDGSAETSVDISLGGKEIGVRDVFYRDDAGEIKKSRVESFDAFVPNGNAVLKARTILWQQRVGVFSSRDIILSSEQLKSADLASEYQKAIVAVFVSSLNDVGFPYYFHKDELLGGNTYLPVITKKLGIGVGRVDSVGVEDEETDAGAAL